MTDGTKAVAAAAITGVLVGAAMVATRSVSSVVPPDTLAFLRYGIGFVFLTPFLLRRTLWRFHLSDALAVSGLGVLQFAVLILLLNFALTTLPAATCALVFSTVPLLTMCFAVVADREQFYWSRALGAIAAMAGIVVLLMPSTNGTLPNDGVFAWAALLGAALLGAFCSLLYRPYLQRHSALSVGALAMLVSVVFLAGFCLAKGSPLTPQLSYGQWAHVAFIGMSSSLGYLCLLWALGRLEASRVMAFQTLAPIVAVVIELLSSAYPLTWRLAGSFALVLSGIYISIRIPAVQSQISR